MKELKEYLTNHILLTDGSFGTYYAAKYETEDMPELDNNQAPYRVEEIHKEYIKAGARLIRTNTFASNTVLLNSNWNEVEANIRAAVEIASKAVDKQPVFVAGDIGPIPAAANMSNEAREEEYYRIANTFIEAGVKILNFETFQDIALILPAIRKIKENHDVFIMVQFSVNQFGYTEAGLSAKKLLKDAAWEKEIDALGLNCGVGPGHMEQIISTLPLDEIKNSGKYFVSLPNAGYPKLFRNKIIFEKNPEYFANKVSDYANKYAVNIVGGCCGTTPYFIELLAQKNVGENTKITLEMSENKEAWQTEATASPKIVKKGFIYNENGELKTKKLIAVELAPPLNADDNKVLSAAMLLKKMDVDVITFPDSPSGRTRIDSVLMAEKVRHETGLTVMPHICCRDKNAIAMRSLFLGAHINDIHNMLIITGDPIPSMVRQTTKAVFNFDSVGLMSIAKEMNEENFSDTPMCYGGAINQGRKNLDVEIGRVKKKMAAGAEFFLSQPVFSKEDADRLKSIKEATGARILCGIMPLISRKNAMFMKNEIPGVDVTDELVERYPENATKEEGEAVGVQLAREMMEYTRDFVDGYYFTFPFNRVYMLEMILV